jgi:uncharacterized protein YndB with AHSA1/START domain
MTDILAELTKVQRETGEREIAAGKGRTIVLRRTYPSPIDDVWNALTDPDRIGRWFLPVTGDLRLGGRYQLQGNAGGQIMRCEPPHLLQVTWVMAENPTPADVSEVAVRLSPGDDPEQTVFELEHVAVVDPEWWGQFGPGAVGVGWDLALLGLSMYLTTGETVGDHETFESSPEARAFSTASSEAWGVAARDAGIPADEVAAMVAGTTAFYVPPQ